MIIAGFGRFGQIVARVLRVKGLPFTALDSNQTHVDFVRRFGNKVYYGDASRLDLLRAAGAESAQILVLAIDDVDASVRTAILAREQFPHLKVFARARNRQHAFALMDAGVTDSDPRDLRLEPGDGGVGAGGARGNRGRGARGGAPLPPGTMRRRSRRSTRSRRTRRSSSPPRAKPRSSWRSCSRRTATPPTGTHDMDEARQVREFWFGQLPLSAAHAQPAHALLVRRRELRRCGSGATSRSAVRFGALFERAARGELAGWADGPRRRLSLVLLLDQFPRNMFRGTCARLRLRRARRWRSRSRACSRPPMRALDVVERIFFYMPLQHAESSEVQDESVAAYRRLLTEAPAGAAADLRRRGALGGKPPRDHRAVRSLSAPQPARSGAPARAASRSGCAVGGETFGQ